MRSDEQLGELRRSALWTGESPELWRSSGDPLLQASEAVAGSVSFSGLERNKLFLNVDGVRFEDVSGLSGADSIADSRGVALFDYDRDGWQDLVLVNTNAPLLELYRNRIGERGNGASFVAVRLVGGNASAAPSDTWSNRDGVGALVEVELDEQTLVRERRTGEGFAVQNSATLLIGIGAREVAQTLRVRWPSGRIQELHDVPAGSMLTVYEKPAEAPGGAAFERAGYLSKAPMRRAAGVRGPRLELPAAAHRPTAAPLRLYVTTATWCEACKGSLPQVRGLRDAFAKGELDLLGVPVDPDDTPEKLAHYVERYAPAYELLKVLSTTETQGVEALVEAEFGDAVLPAAIATDAGGRVLEVWDEVPTLSELRRAQRLLQEARAVGTRISFSTGPR